jgi:hypothetical protein
MIVAVLAAVVSPAFRLRDSYPLSTYPVYATARARTGVLNTAIGIDIDGDWHRLSLGLIADTDDPLIAEDRVGDAIRDGRSDALCVAIASRAAEAGSADENPRLAAIEVVRERLDLVQVAAEGAPPLSRTVHARCKVRP